MPAWKGLLKSDRFTAYWSSATVSYLGDGVRFAALPLFAASLSSSPGEVAAVSAAAGLPWLLFGLVGGVVVDRLDRIRLMTIMQVARAVVGVAIVVGIAFGWMTVLVLVVLVFLLYTCEVLYDIAFNSALPAVVDRSQLQWANGRLITAEVAAFEFVGPALGGVLFALSPLFPFAFDGVTFAVSALLLLVVARNVAARDPRPVDDGPSSVWADFTEGLRWFWGQAVVRAMTLIAVAVNLAAGGLYAVLVLLVRDDLGIGPVGYGLLIAAGAVGSVAAGVAAGRFTSGRQRQIAVRLVVPVTAACFGVIAVSGSVFLVGIALIVFGFTVTVANVIMVFLRQMLTPDAVLGRVMAVHRFFCWGALPVGAAMAGLIGELWGVRWAIVACCLALILVGHGAAAPLLRLPAREFDPEPGPNSTG